MLSICPDGPGRYTAWDGEIALGGCTWREMPEEHGDWNAVYKRYARWRKNGLWSEILRILELEPAPLGI